MIIAKPGLLSTFQDDGRRKYLAQGINRGGAMDRLSLEAGNILLGNSPFEAAMEIHFPGPEILFEEACAFTITGADFGAEFNHKALLNYKIYHAETGDILKFTRKNAGERAYLSVAGGFRIPAWLGSKSAGYSPGNSRLKVGDKVRVNKTALSIAESGFGISREFQMIKKPVQKIRFVAGNEWDLLDKDSTDHLQKGIYEITPNSDRMGYRLSGKKLEVVNPHQLLSSAVSFGTIQLPPDGQMIVLMADAQTTGGYPRIGFVAEVDLPVLAQCGPGQSVTFEKIEFEEAENLLEIRSHEIKKLKASVNLIRNKAG